MYMTSTVTELRISKAKRAQTAAKNPAFKNYWRKVADTLSKYIDD
jgi:hypothetical protein